MAIACLLAAATGVTSPQPAVAATGAPTVTLQADGWHVGASLANTASFCFVVKSAGMPDRYTSLVVPPFLVDPFVYGGKTVTVSARASGPTSNPWASSIQFTVPVPTSGAPVLDARPDRRHVYAKLPGTSTFVYSVKSTGMADAYFQDVLPPFVIPAKYDGRQVRVGARASGPVSNPWAKEVTVDVPVAKQYGIADATGPDHTSGPDAKKLGITLDRFDLRYGESVESMDAKIAASTSSGLTPLPLLVQYGTISQFDLAGWKQWAATVVARYGPGGSFWVGRPDAQYAPIHFELLNEVYGSWFYPTPEPAAYATFFRAVASAARAANPESRFLLAAYPHTFVDASGVWSTKTWDQLFLESADGSAATALAAGITTHPYGSYTGRTGWPTASLAHQDFPTLPVWLTEIGFRIGQVVDGTTVDDELQAAYLQRSLVDFTGWPWAQAYVWFKYADYGPDNQWGVVRSDGSHRASYYAYRDFVS